MNAFIYSLAGLVLLLSTGYTLKGSVQVERWEMFEVAVPGPTNGNPFIDVFFGARFAQKRTFN